MEGDAPRQSHTTFGIVERSSDGGYILKAYKQKLFVDGLSYLLQEIYGLENKSTDTHPNQVRLNENVVLGMIRHSCCFAYDLFFKPSYLAICLFNYTTIRQRNICWFPTQNVESYSFILSILSIAFENCFSTKTTTMMTTAVLTASSACATSATRSSCRAGISVFASRVPKVSDTRWLISATSDPIEARS